MNKKATLLPLEAVVRIVISVIAFIAFIYIVYRVYVAFAYSDADKRFDGLMETIKKMKEEEEKYYSFSLDHGGALIGFTKNGTQIVIDGNYSDGPQTATLDRPPPCKKGTACLCLCTKLENTKPGFQLQPLVCSRSLRCEQLPLLDIQAELTQEVFFNPEWKYKMKNGFIVRRNDENRMPVPQILTERYQRVYLKRSGNMLTVCQPGVCKAEATT